MTDHQLSIRPAQQQDIPLILDFIKALADYEKLRHKVVATEDGLAQALFGERPAAYVIIGEINGVPKGFALFFYSYSTFLGCSNLYLEDLFVAPSNRGSGLGKAMILHLAARAYDEGCGRMDWAVLNWNTPSINFYEALGAKAETEWTGYRLDRAALGKLSGN